MFLRPHRHIVSKRTLFNLPFGSDAQKPFRVTKKINVPPSLLFDVVSDVSKYTEFVPFVTQAFVNEYDGATKLPSEAGLRIGWQQFDEKFTCKLSCSQDKQVIAESITMLLFENLYNEWNFKEVKNRFTNELSTHVELLLKYKFKNPLYNTVSSLFQKQVSDIMIKAFEERAMELKVKSKFLDRARISSE